MTVFDYLILGVIGLSGVLGFTRGLIKELMSLIAYVAAFMAAIWWAPEVSTWLYSIIDNSLLRTAVAYTVVFIISLLGIGLVNKVLAALIEHTGLSHADHGMGMLFGVLRGGVLVLTFVVVAGYTQLPAEPWWQESSLVKTAIGVLMGIKSYLPPNVAEWLPY